MSTPLSRLFMWIGHHSFRLVGIIVFIMIALLFVPTSWATRAEPIIAYLMFLAALSYLMMFYHYDQICLRCGQDTPFSTPPGRH